MEKIYFDRRVNNKKPSTLRNKKIDCPFCDRSQLAGIIDEQEDIILTKNKYSTLENADMFVLIESNVCESDMHTYSLTKIEELLTYGLNKWQELEDSKKYKSVAYFKNKGLHSSGTIKHPHMQFIGFRDQDCMNSISLENLEGHDVIIDELVPFNLSTTPLTSFLEINLRIPSDMKKFARTVSFLADYMEEIYWGDSACYNFFFYKIDNQRYLKIIPRYPTSAITIGYDICQIYKPDQLAEYEQMIKQSYAKWSESKI